MNYHIIPTNNFKIKINVKLEREIKPIISHGLIFFINDINNQIRNLQEHYGKNNEHVSIEYIHQIVNPFEFLHSIVPGSTISVSKIKPDSTIFFELMEIFQTFNINDHFFSKPKIKVCNLTHNHTSTIHLLNMLREDNEDNITSSHFHFDEIYRNFVAKRYNSSFDLIICEFSPTIYDDIQKYINYMILTLIIILNYQMKNGVCFIKIDNIFYKAIIDIVFILSSIFDKIYLVKPSISNITTSDRYIVCKGYKLDSSLGLDSSIDLDSSINLDSSTNLDSNINIVHDKLVAYINKYKLTDNNTKDNNTKDNNATDNNATDNNATDNMYVNTIIENEIPYYILNRIEESNLVIGQQQLEALDQLINIFKNKNRDEKIDNLKKTHIQKCIQWCEKNQLPHNKFIDKINIFLASKDT
jgi:hypothetical protein